MKFLSDCARGFLALGVLVISAQVNAQSSSPSGVQTTTSFESTFVGAYRQGSVDVLSELALFKDNTFCYSVTAGSLDQLITGRWSQSKTAKDLDTPKSIVLTEARTGNASIYPVMGSVVKRLDGKTEIVFDGRSLSEANYPVFAISSSENIPTSFKPLFSEDMGAWAESYFYPKIPSDQAKYLFIGDIQVDAHARSHKLRVVQYRLNAKFDTFRVYFDAAMAAPPLNLTAKLADGVLYVDGARWGAKRTQTQEWMNSAKASCVASAAGRSSDPEVQTDKQMLMNLVTPMKTYQLERQLVQGQAFFDKTYDSSKYADNSVEQAAKQEKDGLTIAFQQAMGDVTNIADFLTFTKKMMDNNVRIKQHALQLVDVYAQLINTTSGRGDFQSSTKLFFHFVDHILPALSVQIETLGREDKEQAQYRISVIASQSLTAAIATKNTVMSQAIFDKILTAKFDITTHKNATLIYNLACFYALNARKAEMLEAVKQARKRGKPMKQFMDDSDFKNYLKDQDFLNAVK